MDGAEEHEAEATDVNGARRRQRRRGGGGGRCSVVYPSTDYVFDGTKEDGYVESDEVGPISAYGQSKLAGEREVAAANPRHFIVRSSWLFGVHGRNFVDTMLGLAEDHDEVVVVRDQVGCPTYTGHLAAGLVRLLDGEDYGIHHMAGRRPLLVVRLRGRDLQPGGRRVPRALDDQRHARPARTAARLLGARERARASGAAARLARGPRRLPRRARQTEAHA